MYRELVLYQMLERLRRETRDQRPALELPLPGHLPYWPEPEKEEVEQGESRGVVIIDMNDYSEVDN